MGLLAEEVVEIVPIARKPRLRAAQLSRVSRPIPMSSGSTKEMEALTRPKAPWARSFIAAAFWSAVSTL